MIHFFLHGGYAWAPSDQNKNFYRSLLFSVKKEKVKIVLLPFARDRLKWEEKKEELSLRFKEATVGQVLEIILVSETGNIGKEELSHADIIFLWWGDTLRLQNALKTISELSEILDGKIVAGSSAWALVFSRFYYENDSNSYHEWLWFFSLWYDMPLVESTWTTWVYKKIWVSGSRALHKRMILSWIGCVKWKQKLSCKWFQRAYNVHN
jgi:peptidase E